MRPKKETAYGQRQLLVDIRQQPNVIINIKIEPILNKAMSINILIKKSNILMDRSDYQGICGDCISVFKPEIEPNVYMLGW